MIGRISGILLEKNPPQILVDVRGVAYEVDVPMSTFYNLPQLGAEVVLHTHLVVREDAHLLFGFGSEAFPRVPEFGIWQQRGVLAGEILIGVGFLLLIRWKNSRTKSEGT